MLYTKIKLFLQVSCVNFLTSHFKLIIIIIVDFAAFIALLCSTHWFMDNCTSMFSTVGSVLKVWWLITFLNLVIWSTDAFYM